jgi:phenylacetate-CoA ligase
MASVCGRLLEPLYDRWRLGSRAVTHCGAIEAFLRLGPHAGRAAADRRLRALVRHAHATVPLYRAKWAAAGFRAAAFAGADDLPSLPPIDKRELAGDPERALSTLYRGCDLVEARTGGTTSRPTAFVQTRGAVDRKVAAAAVLRRRMGWQPGDRAAFLWGARQDLPAAVTGPRRAVAALRRRLVEPYLHLPADDLSDERLDEYARRLDEWGPTALQAYPSAADALARRVLATRRGCGVPLVVLTAETVLPAQRERVAAAFGARVASFYGARECGWIAAECAEGRSHVNTAGVHVEVVEGEILVTDLVNRAMPLVRYRIGDRGALDPAPCPCGDARPVLRCVEGRTVDVFRLPSGRRIPGSLVDLRAYHVGQGILDAQLVQDEPGAIDVNWVAGPGHRPEDVSRLRDRLDRHFDGEVALRLHRVDRIVPEPNGKVRWCICRLPQEVA